MPNWCNNTVVVKAANISKFAEWFGDGKALLSKIIPTPQKLVETVSGFHGDPEEQKKLEEQSAANRKEFGYSNWYDWNVANWGTKWDVDAQIDDYQSSDTEMIFTFESAWGPPEAAMQKLSELFPEITIRHSYLEEGVGFVGVTEFENGEVIDKQYAEGTESDEWRQLASDEFGWEPWPDDDELGETEDDEQAK